MKKNKQKGFTLIELLVVIAIIGILAAIGLSALTSARKKARDSKRKSDLREVSTALELYYADKGTYPTANTFANAIGALQTNGYLDKSVYDPLAANINDSKNSYKYCYSSDNLYYKLDAQLEVTSDASAANDGGAGSSTDGLYEIGNGLGNNLSHISSGGQGDCKKS